MPLNGMLSNVSLHGVHHKRHLFQSFYYRLTSHFITRMEQGELWKQWNWEPRMAESLILLLVDPDDVSTFL